MDIKDCYLKVKDYLRARGYFSERGFIDYLIERIEKSDPSKPFFISAPTGYGKTAISETIALNEYENGYKTIISYPLRSLIEDQKEKMSGLMKYAGMEEIVGLRYMGRPDSPYLIHPITLTTVDTLTLTALGLSPEDIRKVFKEIMGTNYGSLGHYLFSLASVYTSTIVLDEVHLLYDSSKSLSFLRAFIELSKEIFENRLFFMSATIPRKFVQKLGSKNELVYEEFNMDLDKEFYEERKGKKYRINLDSYNSENKIDRIYELVKSNNFNRALVVFNTVEDAINLYRRIEWKEKILIHSRFSAEDRIRKSLQLKNLAGRVIIVGTQSIEAGLDISSDLIICEIAPPNSLIQRFGRFLRSNEKTGNAYIWYENDALENKDDYYKVYDKELIRRTIHFLENHPDINLHIDYEKFLNSVYVEEPEVDFRLIDEIINVITNLKETSKSALELLIELEGSFIRDGNIFTARTENNVEVPVSYSFLKKRAKGALPSEKDAIIESLKGRVFDVKGYYDSEIGLE